MLNNKGKCVIHEITGIKHQINIYSVIYFLSAHTEPILFSTVWCHFTFVLLWYFIFRNIWNVFWVCSKKLDIELNRQYHELYRNVSLRRPVILQFNYYAIKLCYFLIKTDTCGCTINSMCTYTCKWTLFSWYILCKGLASSRNVPSLLVNFAQKIKCLV